MKVGRRGRDGRLSHSPAVVHPGGGYPSAAKSSATRRRFQPLQVESEGAVPQHHRKMPGTVKQGATEAFVPQHPSKPFRSAKGGGVHHPHAVDPRADFDVGFHEDGIPRPPQRLLPWCPRGPEDVCKTYGHIFKLLNDPHLKKRMPKKDSKHSVHVSMPRLPAAGASIASGGNFRGGDTSVEYSSAVDEDEIGQFMVPKKMLGSKSAPGLLSAGASPAGSQERWASASMRADVEGALGSPGRVQLPPLANSAPTKSRSGMGLHGPLGGGVPPAVRAGGR